MEEMFGLKRWEVYPENLMKTCLVSIVKKKDMNS